MGQVHTSHLNSSNVSQLFLFFFVIFLIVFFFTASVYFSFTCLIVLAWVFPGCASTAASVNSHLWTETTKYKQLK